MDQTNKLQDAKRYSVPIITELQFEEIMNPLVGVECLYITQKGRKIAVCIDSREPTTCGGCNDNHFIVRAFSGGSFVYVKTCKCKLEIPEVENAP